MSTTINSGHLRFHHRPLGGWAIGLGVVAGAMIAIGVTTLGIVGFDAGDEEFTGLTIALVSGGMWGGAALSLVAFVMAVVAKLRHESSALLWLPLLLGPVFILTLPLWFG